MSRNEPLRLEVVSRQGFADGRARRLLPALRRDSPAVRDVRIADVYIVHGAPALRAEDARDVVSDSVAQEVRPAGSVDESAPDWDCLVEITAKPGVTDPVGATALQALHALLPSLVPAAAGVQTATQYRIWADASSGVLDPARIASFLFNPLIQSAFLLTRTQWEHGSRPPSSYPLVVNASPPEVCPVDLGTLDDEALVRLSRSRLLALSLPEMKAIQGYFSRPDVIKARGARGLPQAATDVELEMIAQTWSEHCKHKIFNATIRYREAGREEVIQSLFRTYIRATTEALQKKRRFLRSVFHDNSGVIAFDRSTLLCFKVETHNSPSALDPYGGAITGIVGREPRHPGHGDGRASHLQYGRPVLRLPADSRLRGARQASCIPAG